VKILVSEVMIDHISVSIIIECADRCGSCQRTEECTSCRYLASHDNHSECFENTSCTMLGFKVGEEGCGECVCAYSYICTLCHIFSCCTGSN